MNQLGSFTKSSVANAVICAGKLSNKSSCKDLISNHKTWILNLRAPEHICFDSNTFLHLNNLQSPVYVDLPNSQRVKSGSV